MDEDLRRKQQKIAQLEEKLRSCQGLLTEAFTKLARAIVEWKEVRWQLIKALEAAAYVMPRKTDYMILRFLVVVFVVAVIAGVALPIAVAGTGKLKCFQ